MSVIGNNILAGASGAAGGGSKVYVDDVFSTYLYTGTGSAQTITNGIDISSEGGLVWIKRRSGIDPHNLYDTERGVGKILKCDRTNAQTTSSNGLTSFNSNGFTLGTDVDGHGSNPSGEDLVSWTFRKAPGFFDVVTYTGTGSARTIAHSLGSVPGMIIIKSTSSGYDWRVYHRFLGKDYYGGLDSTAAFQPESGTGYVIWNNTEPTSSVFSVGTAATVNANGVNYVAYIFAHDDAQYGTGGDESIIKCGGYAGSSSELDVNVGFEPQWVLIKKATGNLGWRLLDNMRGINTGATDDYFLSADSSDEEQGQDMVDLTATGFRVKNNNSVNGSGHNFIYMAIRRPNKPPEAATEVFAIDTGNSSSTIPCWDSGFPVDFAIWAKPDYTYHRGVGARLSGTKYLKSNENLVEANDPDLTWDSNVGWGKAYASTFYSYMFKRAPGFSDVVAYSGNATSNRAVPHNLEVTPELLILKKRQPGNEHWMVQYTGVFGSNTALQLSTASQASAQAAFNSTSAATASNFYLGSDSSSNGTGKTYIAYLFATLPGISKVGSYSGNTGYAVNVNCGFTSGARFILIKRTNSTGDWYVWDTTRGIVSGNDPYFLLNDDVAQVTNTDYIDPNIYGFTVTASAPAALNATGGTYLFLAIA